MLNVSMNCSPIRPSFARNEDRIRRRNEMLDDMSVTTRVLKDRNADDETKARELDKLGNKISKSMNPTSPFKTVVVTGITTGTGFLLGRKIVGKRALEIVGKNTKVLDNLSAKTEKMFNRLKGIKSSEEKTFKGFMTRLANDLTQKLEKAGTKNISVDELKTLQENPAQLRKTIAQNLTKDGITTTGALVGAGACFEQGVRDNDKNGKPDVIQNLQEASTMSTFMKALNLASDIAC